MRQDDGIYSGIYSRILAVTFFTLLLVVPAHAEPARSQGGDLLKDPQHGLTWIADGTYAVRSGLVDNVVLPRVQALEALARLNAGWVENFGHDDWRLPTQRELNALVAERGAQLRVLSGVDPNVVLETAIDAALGGSGGTGAFQDLVILWPVRGNVVLPGFSNVVLFATNSIELKNNASVTSGDVVVNDASAGPTLVHGFELGLRNKAATPTGYAIKADSIQLKKKSHAGDAFFNELDNKGTIHGTQTTPLVLPVFPLVPVFQAQAPAPGSPGVSVAANDFQVLPPGDYDAVNVGDHGVLVLSGGIYNVASINLHKDAQLLFSATTQVRVAGGFASDKDAVVGPEPGSSVTAHEIVLYVAGVNGKHDGDDDDDDDDDVALAGDDDDDDDDGPSQRPFAVDIGDDNTVNASFYAPNGTLSVGKETVATGAFLARDVLIENRAEIALDSYFFNRPPVAVDDAATVDEGGTVSVLDGGETSLLANDSDPNLDNLSVSPTPVSGPDHGTVVLNGDGTFSYTHDGSETTSDAFGYEVCDDGSPVECATATVSITVNPVNDPPVAADDSATVAEGDSVTVLDSGATSVLANDSDVDSTVLTASFVAGNGPDHGTVVVNGDGTFLYTHDGGETTSDSFDYEVCDDGTPVGCDTGTVNITITPVNDPPVAVADFASVAQGGTVTVLDSGAVSVLANDSDPDSTVLTATVVAGSEPLHGTLTFNTDGTFSYTHDASETSSDGFVYEVCDDGSPTECATAAVSIAVLSDVRITVVKFGLGAGTVTSTPTGINCGAVCSFTFPPTGTIALTATPDGSSIFAGFSGDPDCADGVLQPDGDKTCFARFDSTAPPAVLTVDFAGDGSGKVTSDPGGIDCPGACTASFALPARVTLTPMADDGSTFVGWTGDADCADGILQLLGDASCTAVFEQQPATLTVIRVGLGTGTVTSTPAGIDCGATCSATFPGVPSVTLTAVADAGSVFAGFSGDPDCADGVVTPGSDKTCFARFNTSAVPVVLTVDSSGDGSGRVVSDPNGIDCPGTCSAGFPNPTRVTLSAVADPGSTFVGWTGDADCEDGILNLTADASCTAVFDALPSNFTLTVVFLGAGSGQVASNPPNLFCAGDCSAQFSAGTLVSLSARPSLGSFGGWGGDCSGGGFSTQVLMDADKTCTVTFNVP